MLIVLHKNARTTPAVCGEITVSEETVRVLAQRFGATKQTVYKWKKRSVFGGRSHTAYHLQTVLTPAQETVVAHLRRTLLLPLNDLLAVTREFIRLMSHARDWTRACAAMERANSTYSNPRNLRWPTRPSRATSQLCTRNAQRLFTIVHTARLEI